MSKQVKKSNFLFQRICWEFDKLHMKNLMNVLKIYVTSSHDIFYQFLPELGNLSPEIVFDFSLILSIRAPYTYILSLKY